MLAHLFLLELIVNAFFMTFKIQPKMKLPFLIGYETLKISYQKGYILSIRS